MLNFTETSLFQFTCKDYLEHWKQLKFKRNEKHFPFPIGSFMYVKMKSISTIYMVQIQKVASFTLNDEKKETTRVLRSKQKALSNAEYLPNKKTIYYMTSSGRKTSRKELLYEESNFSKPNQSPFISNHNEILKSYGKEYSKLLSNQKLYFVKLLVRKDQMFVQNTKRNFDSISQVIFYLIYIFYLI